MTTAIGTCRRTYICVNALDQVLFKILSYSTAVPDYDTRHPKLRGGDPYFMRIRWRGAIIRTKPDRGKL